MKTIKYIVFIAICLTLIGKIFYKDLFPYYPYDIETEITVYGRPGCPNCEAFIKGLAENKIPYEFKNVDKEYNEEMRDVVNQVYDNAPRFALPVVVIGDELFLDTGFEKAIESYGERKFVFFGD